MDERSGCSSKTTSNIVQGNVYEMWELNLVSTTYFWLYLGWEKLTKINILPIFVQSLDLCVVHGEFDALAGKGSLGLDLSTMGKGQAWVNGQSIGQYWPSYLVEGV